MPPPMMLMTTSITFLRPSLNSEAGPNSFYYIVGDIQSARSIFYYIVHKDFCGIFYFYYIVANQTRFTTNNAANITD